MSNGMNNKITMWGTYRQISRLKEFVKNEDNEGQETVFDFCKIIPPPIRPLVRFNSLEYEQEDGISWVKKNWGCTSNTWFPKYGEETNQIIFDTVNGTGLKVILKLSKLFPEILFELDSELYMEYYSCLIRNGEILSGTYYIGDDENEANPYDGISLIH